MIGNDIVDLALAKTESNWKRPRFFNKVFTEKEQQYIYKSPQPDKMVWLLWSMKESAYKLYVQLQGKRFFAPKKFSCTVLNINEIESSGMVACDDFLCFTQSEISDQFVYTISGLEKIKDYYGQIVKIKNPHYKSHHVEVYKMVIKQFAKLYAKPVHQISLKKNKHEIPFLYTNKKKAEAAISISHHGNYGAFVIEKFSWKIEILNDLL